MPQILDTIDNPKALKALSPRELKQLCAEIRDILNSTVNSTGGHLASNLGVVELTVAMHRVFDSPRDKFVWDVGHQSYIHKLLTGRKDRFSTLRQFGGISGFPNPEESDYDSFSAGHASTSISAGLGMAIARDLKGEDYHVVSVIGDGALTGGMAFEALNHAGHLGKRMIVILDDNGMSIAPTVGALAKRLHKIRMDYRIRQTKLKTEKWLIRTRLGKNIDLLLRRFERGAKAVLMPTMLWEELGFHYIGPVDGHNISEVETALNQAKSTIHQPAFVHIISIKGKGYDKAEAAPDQFHSVSPQKGTKKPVITYSRAFAQTMIKLVKENPRLVLITAAMTDGIGFENGDIDFPERFFDVGICEEHAVTMAAGLASQGIIPVVAIYSTFLQRGFDQMIHDVCIQDLPVVFAIDRAGIVGEDGKTHQGIFDLSYLSLMPNMIVAAPKDENELQHLLYTAVQGKHPMAIRYPRGSGIGVPLDAELKLLMVGKGEILRNGKDLTLVAIGAMVQPALEAAQKLTAHGIDAGVLNARYAKPLDTDLLVSATQTGRIVTLEENTLIGGLGSSVMGLFESKGISDVIVKRIGIPDIFVEHGSPAILRAKYKLDVDGIVQQVLSFFPDLSRTGLEQEVKSGKIK